MRKILLFTLLTFTLSAQAALYKWVDSSGKVHYSDQPPAGAKAQKIQNGKVKPAAPDKAAPKGAPDQKQEFDKRRKKARESEARQEQEAADAKQQQENCERARANLRTLQEVGRIAVTDEKGERVLMDDATRQRETERAKKDIETWCPGTPE